MNARARSVTVVETQIEISPASPEPARPLRPTASLGPPMRLPQRPRRLLPAQRFERRTRMRRFFPIFWMLAGLLLLQLARFDSFQIDGDGIAYMDMADCIRTHQWAGAVNGYWNPLYPALLSAGHTALHSTLANEGRAFRYVNFAIVLFSMLAVVLLSDSIVRLRAARRRPHRRIPERAPLVGRYGMRYLALGLLLTAYLHELPLGQLRCDPLLLSFLFLAMAALARYLATRNLRWAAAMGCALGLACLTKSFAFAFTAFTLAMLASFARRWHRASLAQIARPVFVAFACFAILAGPWVAALSLKTGRLNFGDSGRLNYAWYTSGTERMHLEPWMTADFGAASVRLTHPEPALLRAPLVLSYAEAPFGTNPDWFDPAHWNEGVRPRFNLRRQLRSLRHNAKLSLEYAIDHPFGLVLAALLLLLGGRIRRPFARRANCFWAPFALLAALSWGTYMLVNVEQRYVTFAGITLLLAFFAMLDVPARRPRITRHVAALLAVVAAVLPLAQGLRTVLEDRRDTIIDGTPGGWYSPPLAEAAAGLAALGVRPGDHVACIGSNACIGDFYWARLAGVRILTEVYAPRVYVYPWLEQLANREQVIQTLRAQGATAVVADFETSRVSTSDPFFRNWHQLGNSTFYAMPLR